MNQNIENGLEKLKIPNSVSEDKIEQIIIFL